MMFFETPVVTFSMRQVLRVIALLSLLSFSNVYATLTANDVNPLLQSGRSDEAIANINEELKTTPKDYNLNFLKAVILAGKNKIAEAQKIFKQLSVEFPDRPEPLNNLAVLLAREGRFDEARSLLDRAMLTDPKYAQVQRNIGDLNAKLASQAYDKALKKNTNNKSAQLSFLRDLAGQPILAPITLAQNTVTTPLPSPVVKGVADNASKAAPAPVAASGASVSSEKPATAEVTAMVNGIKNGPTNVTALVTGIKNGPAAKPTKPAKVTAATTEATQVTQANQATQATQATPANVEPMNLGGIENEVLAVTQSWARAWSARDVDQYLSYYDKQFNGKGQGRATWENDRRIKILGKKKIQVELQTPKVSVSGSRVSVTFTQMYRADALNIRSHKTLVWERQGNAWAIVEERS